MKKLIKAIEKMKPFFDAVARNVYLKSIKDGFISCMPIVIFSSIFLLVAYVPNIFGFHWSANIEAILMKPYNYSMGILAVAVSATTAKHFTDSLNRNMPENNQINSLSTMVCSIICFLMLSADSIKDGYIGLAIIYGAMSLFWFVGVHGPSIVEPAISAALVLNLTTNLEAYQAGHHATKILTLGAQHFAVTFGGTGATLVITLMFAFLAKSKELRAVGRASSIPVLFNVNEPFLFGAPIVLNPVFFVPFIFAPIANIWLLKIFVDYLGMDGFIYDLPWTTPGPIGVLLGLGLRLLPVLYLVAIIAADFIIYYPFFKVYDNEKLQEEAENHLNDIEKEEEEIKVDGNVLKSKRILVLCAGGGTSGLLANALDKAAKDQDIPLITAAGSYGAHMDIMKDYDLVILAPQVASYYEDLKKDTDRLGIKSVACEGKQYISLTRNPEEALKFVFGIMEEK